MTIRSRFRVLGLSVGVFDRLAIVFLVSCLAVCAQQRDYTCGEPSDRLFPTNHARFTSTGMSCTAPRSGVEAGRVIIYGRNFPVGNNTFVAVTVNPVSGTRSCLGTGCTAKADVHFQIVALGPLRVTGTHLLLQKSCVLVRHPPLASRPDGSDAYLASSHSVSSSYTLV